MFAYVDKFNVGNVNWIVTDKESNSGILYLKVIMQTYTNCLPLNLELNKRFL